MNSKSLKLMTAGIGAGALIAGGALTAATSSSADPAAPGPVPSEEATVGETTTESVAPAEPTTSSAVPEITGPAELPPEQQDAL